jgi:hypothetical protein
MESELAAIYEYCCFAFQLVTDVAGIVRWNNCTDPR